jgi:hypothetical protein
MKTKKSISVALGIIQSLVAITAIPAGYSMIIQPDGSKLGIATEILNESPFSDFFIPGLLLFTVIGLGQGFAAVFTFMKLSFYRTFGFVLGIALVIWIMVQVYFINLIHFLQVVLFIIGIVEVILSIYLLNTKKI